MPCLLQFDDRLNYLFVRVSGANTPENVADYLMRVLEECQRLGHSRVLIDENLDGPRLSVDEIFMIAAEGASNALGVFDAIAFVDEQAGDNSYFTETVAVNRGMPIRAFSNVGEAESWLLRHADDLISHNPFRADDF